MSTLTTTSTKRRVQRAQESNFNELILKFKT